LVAGCSPVPSTNFETSQIALNTDVVIDVDLQETVFIAEVSRSGRPINLVDGDRLFVHYEDQRLIATQTDDGEYSASFPFIATGEYRIELSRPRDVSAPNTKLGRFNLIMDQRSYHHFIVWKSAHLAARICLILLLILLKKQILLVDR